MFKIKKSKIGTIIYNHILNNKREYVIITILFFIGIIIGIFFINNANDEQIQEINNYLKNLIVQVKEYGNINFFSLLKKSIFNNLIFIVILWFGASTIAGIPIVHGTVLVKGFSVGYTISSIITCFGIKNGLIIVIIMLTLQNIIFIPTIFAISVSGMRLYKSIMKNKAKENIKLEILRHTVFSTFMLIPMILASLVEVYISNNLFVWIVKYISI